MIIYLQCFKILKKQKIKNKIIDEAAKKKNIELLTPTYNIKIQRAKLMNFINIIPRQNRHSSN